MEGLEVSEILKSELYEPIRIDAETYRPFYLEIENAVTDLNHTYLGAISSVFKKGIFDIKSDLYTNEGVPFARISNLKNMGVNLNDIKYITESENEKNRNTFLEKGDVILSKTAYPAASIVQIENCNTSQDTVAIKLKPKCGIDSGYLVPFLNSKYGFYQMQRWFTGNIQMHLNLTDGKGIFIAKPSQEFQKKVSGVFWKNFKIGAESNDKYSQAEQFLLSELELDTFQPSQEPVNVKSFADSFGTSGRLDAEYYQVKYEQVIERIKSKKHDKLINLVNITKSIEPGSANYAEQGFPFMRVSDFDKLGVSTPDKYLTSDFCTENEELINSLKPKKESILFSKDGSVGTALMLREDAEFITSGAILHLTVKDKKQINPQYLSLVLNSELVQMQAERDAGGSIILHWRVSEISNVIVPIIDYGKQQKIAELVEESFKLKKQSEHLLEVAKKAVEMAIEEDENTALAWINEQTKELELN